MTTPSDPGGDRDEAPYLPPSTPTATGSLAPEVTPPIATAAPPSPGPATATAVDIEAPFVPEPARPEPSPTPEPTFDARAMVESQQRVNANPAYGAMPAATDESREAARALRKQAEKKRRRNRLLGRVLVVLLVAGTGAAGWFGYQAYRDDQDQRTVAPDERRSATELIDDLERDPAGLTPLGNQDEANRAREALNDTVQAGGGGLAGAIDDARDVVGDLNGEAGSDGGAGATPTPFTYDVVVPEIVRTAGERLPDASGRETYVIGADEFGQGDPEAFALFVRLMAVQPQLIPTADAFDGLPRVEPDQIVISVDRDGERIDRAIVSGQSVNLRVDVTP